jgi:hypothetical protein
MKKTVLVLLLLNIALAAVFLARERLPGATATAEHAPLNVERMRLRGHSATTPDSGAAPASRDGAYCVEWRGLAPAEFARAREQLKDLVTQRVMSFSEIPLNTRYRVIFPPLPSAESARLKLAEFAAGGVGNAAVIVEGGWENAILLGTYPSIEAARQRVSEVEGRGVLGAQIEQEPVAGTEFFFVVRSEDGEALKNLNDLKAEYPNSQLSRVACQAP